MHAIRKTPFPPFSPLIPVPVNATPNPAIIHAMTLCEVINRNNSAPNRGPILPAFLPDPITLIQRRSDPITLTH